MSTAITKQEPLTVVEWREKAIAMFGEDEMRWRWKCPSCGHVASTADYKAAGAPSSAVGFSCVGRWLPNGKPMFDQTGGPCDYAGGGLICLNPVIVMAGEHRHEVFEFAPEEPADATP